MVRTAMAGFVGVLVGAALVGVVTAQQEELTAKVVRAERFEVVDSDRNTRALLGVRADMPSLVLYGKDRKGTVILEVLFGGPRLALYNGDGPPRISLGVPPDGMPALTLRDKDGRTRAVLGAGSPETVHIDGAHQRPESSLVLFDKDGKVLWEAP